ncbi:MAG: hypothetical protein ACLFN1_03745 [Bacteroidales bacterium]
MDPMNIIGKYKNFILLVTFPVLLLFITNSLVNRHNHLIQGYKYIHAHPFNQESGMSEYPSHNHTDAELVALEFLSNLEILVGLTLIILFTALKALDMSMPCFHGLPAGMVIALCSPRAPPPCS